ncbi:putative kinase [Tamaricihabitans halophyticus]|uniref:Putative kinase n=1 Tax=Tamaricihabitans halophyticus TaxID=1262583 RepID=A0A4R2R5A4_9PSEU|nr:ATP-binding protein [Tamaricihabitans halophyticus]TCP56969.1 putative kinase [Tamaricihabitans halophyticus]
MTLTPATPPGSAPAGTLIATIGPPGAGKTTWRRQFLATTPATVVSLDELRARFSPCGCSADHSVNQVATAHGLRITHQALQTGGTVVWDTTAASYPARASMLACAAAHHARTIAVVILPPLIHALRRNARRDNRTCRTCARARRVPDHRIWAMHTHITAALPALHREGWHEIHLHDLPPYIRQPNQHAA